MALTESIRSQPSPIYKECEHVYSASDAEVTLITGISGKRIRIWRLHGYCAGVGKTCVLYSGTNNLDILPSTVLHILHSTDGYPVFTCNAGENFIVTPSDQTSWVFYVVYSIE